MPTSFTPLLADISKIPLLIGAVAVIVFVIFLFRVVKGGRVLFWPVF